MWTRVHPRGNGRARVASKYVEQNRMWRAILARAVKRVSRWGAVYALYLAIVWLFDYVYFPWLTIEFKALVFLPLFVSVFLVSWGGYYLYEYFQEDVLLTERINEWLRRPGARGLPGKLKALIVNNPRWTFAAIATWWSPLHAYVFFRREATFELTSFLKSISKGSLCCALFWGAVGESVLYSWKMFKFVLR